MKKALNLLAKHVEKIVLALMMVALICVIGWQYLRIKDTQKRINETTKIDLGGGTRKKKRVAKIDEEQFDLRVDVQTRWKPAYTGGKWEKYAAAGDPAIFRRYKRPPIADEEFREYLTERGAGSLFDPQFYVYPIDGQKYYLGFESPKAFWSPHKQDYPVKGDDDDDDEVRIEDGVQVPPLAKWLRLNRVRKKRLSFTFNSTVAPDLADKSTWAFTFKVGSRTSIVKIGDEIPGTSYVVMSAEHKTTENELRIKKTTYRVTVAHEKDDTIRVTLKKRERAPDPQGETSYEFYFFPGKSKIRGKDGSKISLEWEDVKEEYELEAKDEEVTLILLKGGEPTKKTFEIPRVKSKKSLADEYEAWQAWEKKYKEKK